MNFHRNDGLGVGTPCRLTCVRDTLADEASQTYVAATHTHTHTHTRIKH